MGAIPAPRLVLSRARLPAPVCSVCQEGQIYCGLMTCPEQAAPPPPAACLVLPGLQSESVPTSGSAHPASGTQPWTVQGTLRGHPAPSFPSGWWLSCTLRQLSLRQRLMCSICIIIPGSRKEGTESEAGRRQNSTGMCWGAGLDLTSSVTCSKVAFCSSERPGGDRGRGGIVSHQPPTPTGPDSPQGGVLPPLPLCWAILGMGAGVGMEEIRHGGGDMGGVA